MEDTNLTPPPPKKYIYIKRRHFSVLISKENFPVPLLFTFHDTADEVDAILNTVDRILFLQNHLGQQGGELYSAYFPLTLFLGMHTTPDKCGWFL